MNPIDAIWIVHHHPEGKPNFFRVFTSFHYLLVSLQQRYQSRCHYHLAWLAPYRIYYANLEILTLNDVTDVIEHEASHYHPNNRDIEEPGMPQFETGDRPNEAFKNLNQRVKHPQEEDPYRGGESQENWR